jgi:predicted nucleic acid-binding protein
MTRYAIDALTAIRLVRDGDAVASTHQLVGPKVLQSRALSIVYGQVRRGELDRKDAVAILDGITTMKIRLLGDRVSRGVAWKFAEELDWDDTADAEFVSVAKLQADAFVTLDPDLAVRVAGVVTVAPYEALLTR